MENRLPILYSFRRCPYAIRARMAIWVSGQQVELREVQLKNKPQAMLDASPKGTVPVLVLPDQTVLEESRALMRWALNLNDPESWSILAFEPAQQQQGQMLIEDCDDKFKPRLDRYKYADRYPEHTQEYYRSEAEPFLIEMDRRLEFNDYLIGEHMTEVDVAIFPFVRQFAFVNKTDFDQRGYQHLSRWLNNLLQSPLFLQVMEKYPVWQECSANPSCTTTDLY